MPKVPGKRVLIVDDNKSIRETIAEYLGARGYQVLQAADGIKGLDYGLSSPADVIVLDVVMPGLDGVRLWQTLRAKGVTTPIIMLTEKSAIADQDAGFNAGVVDHLARPFSARELELRIEALERRTQTASRRSVARIVSLGEVEIDMTRHTVKVEGKDVYLTPIEFNFLKLLALTPGRVSSR